MNIRELSGEALENAIKNVIDELDYTYDELETLKLGIRNQTINEILKWIEDDIKSHTEKIAGRVSKSYPSCEMIVEHLKEMTSK